MNRFCAKVCICNAAIFIFGIWFAYQLPRVRENYMPLFGGIFGVLAAICLGLGAYLWNKERRA